MLLEEALAVRLAVGLAVPVPVRVPEAEAVCEGDGVKLAVVEPVRDAVLVTLEVNDRELVALLLPVKLEVEESVAAGLHV